MNHNLPPARLLGVAVTCLVLFVVLLFLFLSVNCASTSTGKRLNVAVVGAAISDLASTEYAKAHGAHEANPVIGASVLRHTALKFAGVGGVIAAAGLLDRTHPRWAQVVRVVPVVIWSSAAMWNVNQVRTR